ncbi:MAG: FAD-dependent oxidoreductase, partial [Treponema sp.]|nr:FAD-dependent oxidoreductase [Treponema sp.]
EVSCVFILRENIPPAQLISGIEMDGNHIKVDRRMRTNIPGFFAAGDITGTPYQYAKSAGEGNVAALSAADFLSVAPKK